MRENITNIEQELLDSLESLRINVDIEAWYDPTGAITRRCERANEMLDDCLEIVKNTFSKHCGHIMDTKNIQRF